MSDTKKDEKDVIKLTEALQNSIDCPECDPDELEELYKQIVEKTEYAKNKTLFLNQFNNYMKDNKPITKQGFAASVKKNLGLPKKAFDSILSELLDSGKIKHKDVSDIIDNGVLSHQMSATIEKISVLKSKRKTLASLYLNERKNSQALKEDITKLVETKKGQKEQINNLTSQNNELQDRETELNDKVEELENEIKKLKEHQENIINNKDESLATSTNETENETEKNEMEGTTSHQTDNNSFDDEKKVFLNSNFIVKGSIVATILSVIFFLVFYIYQNDLNLELEQYFESSKYSLEDGELLELEHEDIKKVNVKNTQPINNIQNIVSTANKREIKSFDDFSMDSTAPIKEPNNQKTSGNPNVLEPVESRVDIQNIKNKVLSNSVRNFENWSVDDLRKHSKNFVVTQDGFIYNNHRYKKGDKFGKFKVIYIKKPKNTVFFFSEVSRDTVTIVVQKK